MDEKLRRELAHFDSVWQRVRASRGTDSGSPVSPAGAASACGVRLMPRKGQSCCRRISRCR